MKTATMSRFDTRLPKEQKEFFEYAASLGGFRTLTDFIIYSVQQQASSIVEKHNAILASKKDQDIFFRAIMNAAKPNEQLRKAASRYKKATHNK
jgi:uncharacterized protein (DUF1778 family)